MVPENIRFRFTKTGSLQFISHLDLCRTVKTALVRTKIPIWYSEGFNPHPKMVFALPLSIGIQSECELVDIKLTGEPDSYDGIKNRFSAAFTEEMKIIEAYKPVRKFSEIAWAEYDIFFDGDCASLPADFFEGSLVVTKRTKSGEKETDILPWIKRARVFADEGKINVLLSSSGESYLNPDYVAAAVSARIGVADYSIMRKNMYLSDGKSIFA